MIVCVACVDTRYDTDDDKRAIPFCSSRRQKVAVTSQQPTDDPTTSRLRSVPAVAPRPPRSGYPATSS